MRSPCVNLCNNTNGVCTGCGRTMSQIQNWARMTEDQRQAILNELGKEPTDEEAEWHIGSTYE